MEAQHGPWFSYVALVRIEPWRSLHLLFHVTVSLKYIYYVNLCGLAGIYVSLCFSLVCACAYEGGSRKYVRHPRSARYCVVRCLRIGKSCQCSQPRYRRPSHPRNRNWPGILTACEMAVSARAFRISILSTIGLWALSLFCKVLIFFPSLFTKCSNSRILPHHLANLCRALWGPGALFCHCLIIIDPSTFLTRYATPGNLDLD